MTEGGSTASPAGMKCAGDTKWRPGGGRTARRRGRAKRPAGVRGDTRRACALVGMTGGGGGAKGGYVGGTLGVYKQEGTSSQNGGRVLRGARARPASARPCRLGWAGRGASGMAHTATGKGVCGGGGGPKRCLGSGKRRRARGGRGSALIQGLGTQRRLAAAFGAQCCEFKGGGGRWGGGGGGGASKYRAGGWGEAHHAAGERRAGPTAAHRAGSAAPGRLQASTWRPLQQQRRHGTLWWSHSRRPQDRSEISDDDSCCALRSALNSSRRRDASSNRPSSMAVSIATTRLQTQFQRRHEKRVRLSPEQEPCARGPRWRCTSGRTAGLARPGSDTAPPDPPELDAPECPVAGQDFVYRVAQPAGRAQRPQR